MEYSVMKAIISTALSNSQTGQLPKVPDLKGPHSASVGTTFPLSQVMWTLPSLCYGKFPIVTPDTNISSIWMYKMYILKNNCKGREVLYYVFLSIFLILTKEEVGLCDHHAVCVFMYPPYQSLNGWTILRETWYVCHSNAAHLNGILHKSPSHQSTCLYAYTLIIVRKRLGINVTTATNTHETRELLEAPSSMRLVSYSHNFLLFFSYSLRFCYCKQRLHWYHISLLTL
jgi:hypothetical protein